MYFNVWVLIVAACLLGLISNLSTMLSNNCTQTHDLFRLYMVRSKQIFLNNQLWAWNIYLCERLKFDLTTNQNMNKDKQRYFSNRLIFVSNRLIIIIIIIIII